MAKLVVISKGQPRLFYSLSNHWVTIGRNPGNAFQLPESSVSGQHCEVKLQGNELMVRDMRSTNGTFINDSMISKGVLRPGDVLRLAQVELYLEPAMEPSLTPSHDLPHLHKEADHAAPGLPSSNGRFGASRHQVLLVDDSMAFLETAGDVFEAFSKGEWEVHRACGADQALSIIQRRPIKLAVLDINMPMLDGLQLLTVLHRRHPEVKKVVLTSHR